MVSIPQEGHFFETTSSRPPPSNICLKLRKKGKNFCQTRRSFGRMRTGSCASLIKFQFHSHAVDVDFRSMLTHSYSFIHKQPFVWEADRKATRSSSGEKFRSTLSFVAHVLYRRPHRNTATGGLVKRALDPLCSQPSSSVVSKVSQSDKNTTFNQLFYTDNQKCGFECVCPAVPLPATRWVQG